MDHTPKSCSRCSTAIECRANDISKCDCAKIEITKETTRFLKQTNYNCLCNECLSQVDQLVVMSEEIPKKMIPKIHYYIENGNYVFTELYHIQRGYCCGSGCRHCAYGFRTNDPKSSKI